MLLIKAHLNNSKKAHIAMRKGNRPQSIRPLPRLKSDRSLTCAKQTAVSSTDVTLTTRLWLARDEASGPEAELDHDMPANDSPVWLGSDREQVHFADAVLHAANGEKA